MLWLLFVFVRFGLVTGAQKSEADGDSHRRLGSPDMEWFPETKQTQENAKNQEMDKQSSDPQSTFTAHTI